MRPPVVVVVDELVQGGLQVRSAAEELAGEQLVAEPAEEALDVAVLTGLARLDEAGLTEQRGSPKFHKS